MIIKNFQITARRRNWHKRSNATVLRKIESLVKGKPNGRRCVYDNWNKLEFARLIGVSKHQIYNWVKYYDLPFRQVTTTKTAISRKDFYEWAYFNRHHRLLKWCDPEALIWVLEDERLVKMILECPVLKPKPVKGRLRPVRCVTTKETFESVREAAKAHCVDPTAISHAICRNKLCLEREYEFIIEHHPQAIPKN